MNYSLLQDQVLVFYGNVAEFHETDWLPALSEKESARAEQYRLQSDKRRYIISRAVLKQLLSRFLQTDEREIELNYGKNGKPFLSGNRHLQFNISHSGRAFVIGFARGMEIGIDVESLDRTMNISNLQSYLFTPAELKLFCTIHNSRRQEAFINCWTRKEAMLKATGDGLTQPMNALNLSFGKPDWFLESYTLMNNYRGAVAVNGHVKDVQYISINREWLFNKAS